MMKRLLMSVLLMACLLSVEAQNIVENGETVATMSDVSKDFPLAKSVVKISGGVYDVQDGAKESIGKLILSTYYANGIQGFGGPTTLMVAISNDGIIKDVTLLPNDETPKFVARVRNAGLFSVWNGMKLKDAANKEVDAVTGATYTSTSVIKTMKALASSAVIPQTKTTVKAKSIKKK